MTRTLNRSRQPKGITIGGEFATEAKAESGVTLGAPSTASTGAHYVYIERQYSPDLALGPYPTAEAAQLACNESMLVTGYVEEDSLECWADDGATLAKFADSFQVVGVDLNDPHDTGEPPLAEPDTLVRIEDPDDAFSPPLYEGPAAGASKVLAAGNYRALAADDVFTEYTVRVEGAGAP